MAVDEGALGGWGSSAGGETKDASVAVGTEPMEESTEVVEERWLPGLGKEEGGRDAREEDNISGGRGSSKRTEEGEGAGGEGIEAFREAGAEGREEAGDFVILEKKRSMRGCFGEGLRV